MTETDPAARASSGDPVLLLAPARTPVLRELARLGIPHRLCASVSGLIDGIARGAALLVIPADTNSGLHRRLARAMALRTPNSRPAILVTGPGPAFITPRALARTARVIPLPASTPPSGIRALLGHSLDLRDARGALRDQDITVRHLRRSLHESEERLRVALMHSPLVVAHVDRNLRYEWIHNPDPGFSSQRIVGRRVDEVGPGGTGSEMAQLKQQVLATGVGVRTEICFPQTDGQHVYDVMIEPLRGADGELLGANSAALDITKRKQHEQRLREGEERLAAIVQCSNDAIIGISLEGVITSWNAAATRMYGYQEGDAVGRPLSLLVPPERADELDQLLSRLRRGERIEPVDSERRHQDGRRLYVSLTVSPVRDGDGVLIAAATIERDISDRRRMQEQLYRVAFHDSLTGLPNRALFLDRLQHLIDSGRRQPRRYAVFVIDLDNFKVVNDSLGHLYGDELLIEVARRINQCLRPSDTLARFGGDEFTVLLEDVEDLADVLQVVGRIQTGLVDSFRLRGHQVQTSASIGIALSEGDYLSPDAVLRDADTALYQAKALGKNCHVLFEPPMRAIAIARLRLETELREAIASRRLTVHYQPIVCLASRRIVGCEALARWHDPSLGNIPPEAFIPVAEETGLILPLGEFVLETAMRELGHWARQGIATGDFYVSVNLSTKQFSNPGLGDQIVRTLSDHGLHGAQLRLEITESLMMSQDTRADEVLAQLRVHGVRICMDDFGTGYSSLSYLQRFPIDVLKVDKSFVHGMANEAITREIVRTVVGLAEGLHSEAIAEGVESEEHLAQLTALGFRRGQGFLFHAAMPGHALADLLIAAPAWSEQPCLESIPARRQVEL